MRLASLTLLNLLRVARGRGVEVDGLFEGLPWGEQALEEEVLDVAWDDGAVLLNRLALRLERHDLDAVLREHVQTHPLLRLLSQYAASVNGWLELWWGLQQSGEQLRYELTAEHHCLRVEPSGAMACPLWNEVLRATAIYAPVHLGARPLSVLRQEVGPRAMELWLSAPGPCHLEARRSRSSQVGLAGLFASLESLGRALEPDVRDGHPHLEPDESRDEVSLMSEHWALTPTEARVTLLLASGLVPKEIAATLGRSVATVRVHLKSVYAKTGTFGQRELVDRVGAWRLR